VTEPIFNLATLRQIIALDRSLGESGEEEEYWIFIPAGREARKRTEAQIPPGAVLKSFRVEDVDRWHIRAVIRVEFLD